MKKILFVCHGNICRSVTAEFVFRHMAEEAGVGHLFEVDSAATSREEIGNPIYPLALHTMETHGIHGARHAARQVTRHDYDYYDHLVLMDSENLYGIRRIIPDDPEGKVHTLLSYTGRDAVIPDPWYTDDFESAYRDILRGCKALFEAVT